MNFGLSALASDVFIRYRHEVPGFQLIRARSRIAVVDRLLLHIDFPSAEDDTSVGEHARGTGVIEYFSARPPEITSRDINRAGVARNVGFVLDVASPYPIILGDGTTVISSGIGPHVFASGLVGAKEAFSEAYNQYKGCWPDGNRWSAGIPVYDCYGWQSSTEAGSVIHKPRLWLVGFTSDLSTPLSTARIAQAAKLRDEYMATHKLHRARLGVANLSESFAPGTPVETGA